MKCSILKGNFIRSQKRAIAHGMMALVLVSASGACRAEAADERELIELNAAQRAHVLGEMRTLLSGTQAILAALAKDDMAAVAQQASALGMAMSHKPENHMHDVLPPGFMQLGMSVHQDFDRIASDAVAMKDGKHTLEQLSSTLNTCAVCHEAYQIQVSKKRHQP